QEMMGSRAFTTVSARLVWPHRRPGNLTRYRSKDQVSFKSDAAFPDRFPRDHKRREPRLHIGRTQTENFAVSNGALEIAVRFELSAKHSIFISSGIACIHVTVDHERDTVAAALQNADGIDAIRVDFLEDRLDAMTRIPIQNKLADPPLGTGRACDIDELFCQLSQLLPLNATKNIFPFLLTDHVFLLCTAI